MLVVVGRLMHFACGALLNMTSTQIGGSRNTPRFVDKLGMNDLCGQRGRGSQKLINCFGLSSWVLDVKYESPLSLALSSAEAREAGVP